MVLANCPISNSNTGNAAIDPTAFYTALWNTSEFGMYALEVIDAGADFRFIDFNQTCTERSPIPTEQLMGRTLFESFPEEVAKTYQQHYAQCVHTRQSTSFEESFPIDGLITHWRLTVYPLLLANGSVYQLVVQSTDITTYKHNVDLMESRRVLQQVIDTMPAAIFWKDRHSQYLGCNQAFADIAGSVSVEAIMGKSDYDLAWKKEESDWFVSCDQRIMQADQPELNIIEPQLQASGRQAWLRTSKIPLHDSAGKVNGILGIIEDITEYRETELEQQRLLDILAVTPDVVGISDAEGNNQYLNRAGQQLFGIPTEQIDKFHISEVTHPNATEQVLQIAMPTAIEQGSWRGESQVITRQGKAVPVSQVIICHRDEAGKIAYFSTVLRDISERKAIEIALKQQSEELSKALQQLKKTQTQIIQAEKMSSLGQMVAGVAHEINNPVNFIHGNIQPASNYIEELLDLISLYRETYPQSAPEIDEALDSLDIDFVSEDLPKLLGSMSIGTSRIREIVLSLRNFSRLDESEVKTVNLHEGIDSTLIILNHRFKKDNIHKAIEVVKDYQDLPLVACYPSQLNQVLMNILANAIDALAAEPNPIITVSTEHRDDTVSIRIRDNGPGIPEEIRPQILDPFFTTKEVGKGTGMGMSISYQIVTEKHGGQLTFSSKVGQGTEFCITLPIRQPGDT